MQCRTPDQTGGDRPATQPGPQAGTVVGDTRLGAAVRGCVGEPAVPRYAAVAFGFAEPQGQSKNGGTLRQ